MINLKCLTFIIVAALACQSRNRGRIISPDSISIMETILVDSTINTDYLNSYRKKAIPISVKPMSTLKTESKFDYHTNYSEGKFTLKDTLYIFSEIKSYTGSASRVNLNIPSEGVRAHYYIIKIQNKWTIVKDSTSMYET